MKACKTKLERRALKIFLFSLKTKFLLASYKFFFTKSFQKPSNKPEGSYFELKTPTKTALEMPLADFFLLRTRWW
jgi:hypothetical protein